MTRSSRAAATRFHQLDLKTPRPARDAVLRNSANKAQLNSLICEQILIDEQYLQQVTQHHRLVVTGDDAMTTQESKGRKMPHLDIATTQEEADLIITQQAIHLAKEDGESRDCVLCDAGVFLIKGTTTVFHDDAVTNSWPFLHRYYVNCQTARCHHSCNLASPSTDWV